MGDVISHICDFCGQAFPLVENITHQVTPVEFEPARPQTNDGILRMAAANGPNHIRNVHEHVFLSFYSCPCCRKTGLTVMSTGGTLQSNVAYRYPPKGVQSFPDYIPNQIRDDYNEAALILDLSPKASATLLRRCLQSIIRDFWGITPEFWNTYDEIRSACHVGKDKVWNINLYQEIKAVELMGGIGTPVIAAFKQLKDIGNIGAHPAADVNLIVDVEPGEAETLLALINLIIRQTYIQRNADQELLQEVERISVRKAEQQGGVQ